MHAPEGNSTWFVCVCLSVRTISAIARNTTPKKGHHKNQRPMGKILKGVLILNLLFQSYGNFPVYTVPKVGHFITSVSMRKGLRAIFMAYVRITV